MSRVRWGVTFGLVIAALGVIIGAAGFLPNSVRTEVGLGSVAVFLVIGGMALAAAGVAVAVAFAIFGAYTRIMGRGRDDANVETPVSAASAARNAGLIIVALGAVAWIVGLEGALSVGVGEGVPIGALFLRFAGMVLVAVGFAVAAVSAIVGAARKGRVELHPHTVPSK